MSVSLRDGFKIEQYIVDTISGISKIFCENENIL